jgi:hypothetical protein
MGYPIIFNYCKKRFPYLITRSSNATIMNSKQLSAKELLEFINNLIETGQYNDSVHKIKLMTARDVIEKILESEF